MAGTIPEEISRLGRNVNNTLDAVVSMGGTVEPGYNSDNMAAAVYSIPSYSLETAENISVPASAWVLDSSSEDYPYKAAIAIDGVTANWYPTVSFGHAEAETGNYSTVAESFDGGVYIFAVVQPTAAFNIPTISFTPRPTAEASANIVRTNISVPVSAWIPDSSSAAYSFKAAIAVSGVTGDHYPEIAFGFVEAGNGNYSTVAETYDGGVYIYAAKKPSSAIIVASLVCTLTE